MAAQPKRILIVGCGIAGPTLASFLLLSPLAAALKPHITILERSPTTRAHLRGQNIDIRAAGVTIIRKLGLEKVIRAATTGEEGIQLVDQYDRVWSQNRADKSGKLQTPTSDIEILRGRLAGICWRGSKRVSARAEKEGVCPIEYLFGDYLDDLEQDASQVKVRFAKSGERRAFDIVVGADGVTSLTRKMAFGIEGEAERVHRIGMYAGFFSIPREEKDGKWRRWFHAPGRRGVMLRPDDTGTRSTIFMYVVNDTDPRLAQVATSGHEGVEAQKDLLEEYFRDAGWECERILRGMRETDDFYYDAVAQVKMDQWSKGRVVLLGDAGYCASPISGMGTTLGFTGAYNLAGCLQGYLKGKEADPSAAFAAYEAKIRPTIETAHKLAPGQPKLINPETAWGVWTMRVLIKSLSMTKIILIAVKFFGKLLNLGPQAASSVPVDDYGFQDMPMCEVKDEGKEI